jgi:predicted HTH domain antitoxin
MNDPVVDEAAVNLAIQRYQEKSLGLGKAAKLAGVPKIVFIEILGRRGISTVDYDPAELEIELQILKR